MNKFIKYENIFLKKGVIIQKVENTKSLNYIDNLIKKKIIKILKLKISVKKLNLNRLHLFLGEKNLNQIRLELINKINRDKNFKKSYFLIAEKMLENIIGNELAMQNNINLSIQLPEDESSLLPIHSDTWSGDSPFESVL